MTPDCRVPSDRMDPLGCWVQGASPDSQAVRVLLGHKDSKASLDPLEALAQLVQPEQLVYRVFKDPLGKMDHQALLDSLVL